MIFLLPILLQIQTVSDQKLPGISVNSAEFPVWVDFTRCLSDGMKRKPDTEEQNPPVYEAVVTTCRETVQQNIVSGNYNGISPKPKNQSHKRAIAVLDGTEQQMRTVYSRLPDVGKINARVETMGLGVRVYDPIAHLYDQYSVCLSSKYREAPFRHLPSERVAGWQEAIKSCATLKAALKLEAEPIMVGQPDFQDAEKRKSAIDATFDGHDEMILKAASIEWGTPE